MKISSYVLRKETLKDIFFYQMINYNYFHKLIKKSSVTKGFPLLWCKFFIKFNIQKNRPDFVAICILLIVLISHHIINLLTFSRSLPPRGVFGTVRRSQIPASVCSVSKSHGWSQQWANTQCKFGQCFRVPAASSTNSSQLWNNLSKLRSRLR